MTSAGKQGLRVPEPKNHPCISPEALGNSGRVHLPVSPTCNIQCGFCLRQLHPTRNSPGVTRQVISPQAAAERVDRALQACPEIAVAGIAGPGEPLASDHAIQAFELIHARHPGLLLCLSTNGLELPRKANRLWQVGLRSITVTVNALDPDTLSSIVPRIFFDQHVIAGPKAAQTLIAQQLEGIQLAAHLGVFVKVNFVLIPSVNDQQIAAVARATAALGAQRINIIPLLPQGRFANHRAPDCAELGSAQMRAEAHLPVFRHCQRCRADACGIPGKPNLLPLADLIGPSETFSHG